MAISFLLLNVLVSNFHYQANYNIFFGQEACDVQNRCKTEEVSLPFIDAGDWQITGQSSAEKFHHTLRTSRLRPASVTITGSNWAEADLLKLLTAVSTTSCNVHLKPDDAFEKSQDTTSHWIANVISENHKFVYLM